MVKKTCLFVALILMLFFLAGCQTVKGVGRDVEWIGEKTTEAAESLE